MVRDGVHDKYQLIRMKLRNSGKIQHDDELDILMREVSTEIDNMENTYHMMKERAKQFMNQVTKLQDTTIDNPIKFGMELERLRKKLEDVVFK